MGELSDSRIKGHFHQRGLMQIEQYWTVRYRDRGCGWTLWRDTEINHSAPCYRWLHLPDEHVRVE